MRQPRREIFCAISGFKDNLKDTSEVSGEIDSGEQILISPQFVLAAGSAAGLQTTVIITEASASNEAAQPLVMKVTPGKINVLRTNQVKGNKRVKIANGRDISGVTMFERFKWMSRNKDNFLFWP
jgi:hypothetical protein